MIKTMRNTILLAALLAFTVGPVLLAAAPSARADAVRPMTNMSRIKDLADVEGVRQNQLVGYGLVVGLQGTGDSLNNSPFTRQSLTAMLERLGVNTRGANLRTANVAAVMVTANLPAFSTQGTRLDVTVSALGDAGSLDGGTLLVTTAPRCGWRGLCRRPGLGRRGRLRLRGRCGPVFSAVCRRSDGSRTARWSSARSNSRSPKNAACGWPCAIPTLPPRAGSHPPSTISSGADAAAPSDPSTVHLRIPENYAGNMIELLTEVEQLRVRAGPASQDRRGRALRHHRDGS